MRALIIMHFTYNDILTRWKEKKIDSTADLDVTLGDFRVLFAYNSNKIEGSELTIHQTREIFENGKVVGYTGDLMGIEKCGLRLMKMLLKG